MLKVIEMAGNEKVSIILFEKVWSHSYSTYYCKFRNIQTQELTSDWYEYSSKQEAFYRFVDLCDKNGIFPF